MCVDICRIGRGKRVVGRIDVMVRMVAGRGRLGRRQQPEQLVIGMVFVWVLMVVPDKPKSWERQPYEEKQREPQGA